MAAAYLGYKGEQLVPRQVFHDPLLAPTKCVLQRNQTHLRQEFLQQPAVV